MPEDAPRANVRPATSDESLAVRRVLDGALLEVNGLDERIAAGEVLVAVDDGRICGAIVVAPEGPIGSGETDASPVSGDGPAEESTGGATTDRESTDAESIDGDAIDGDPEVVPERCRDAVHVRAVAVRRRRRGSGIGSELVRDAAARFGALAADFDDDLRPFYAPLAEAVVAGADGRLWARIEVPA